MGASYLGPVPSTWYRVPRKIFDKSAKQEKGLLLVGLQGAARAEPWLRGSPILNVAHFATVRVGILTDD
jgi:hypothetical protein